MTQLKVMQFGLRRAGLSESTSVYQDYARDAFNLGKDDLASRHPFTWLAKKSATLRTTDGQRVDTLATDVLWPISFFNKTDNWPIRSISKERIYELDPDDDEEGPVTHVALTGIDGTSGAWEASWYQIPDTGDGASTGDEIYYTYHTFIADRDSSVDGTDLKGVMPLWAQQGLIWYISANMKATFGNDLTGEQQDLALYEKKVAENIKVNTQIQSSARTRSVRKNGRGMTGSVIISDVRDLASGYGP